MSAWSIATATVSKPQRGSGTQPYHPAFALQSLSLTWAWGSQPAQGILTYVAQSDWPAIQYGAWIEITAYGRTFYGVCQRGGGLAYDNKGNLIGSPTERSSGGNTMRVEFLDPRTYLRWDQVFCAFNILDIRLVNGVRVRRYKHLFPEFYQRYIWYYTTSPVSAAFIISKILSFTRNQGGTIGSDWVVSSIWPDGSYHAGAYRKGESPIFAFHPDQNYPIYNLDCLSGKLLDEVLNEIAEAQGLLFTLQDGPFNLVWCRKGDGAIPEFPTRADNLELTRALSQNPTRLYVVGDRNRYLCLDLELTPDWNTNWQQLITVDGLMQDLFDHETDPISGEAYNAITGDTEQAQGYELAAARAREITVREYATLRAARDSIDFTDLRLFGGRCRMDMPAALYLEAIVYRAFRPPAFVNLKGEQVPTVFLELIDDLFCRIYLEDPTSAKMSLDINNPPIGNGFAIARGFNIGSEIFKAIKPERFSLQEFIEPAKLWQQVTFQIDDSMETGRYVLMDDKMIDPLDDNGNPAFFVSNDVMQILYPDETEPLYLNGYQQILRADAQIRAPKIRAALVFEADRFIATFTSGVTDNANGTRDDKINEAGLYQEIVQGSDGSWVQMRYADGLLAEQKAEQIANVLLKRPYWYYQGHYNWKLLPGDVIPSLTGMINRISIEYSSQGHICDVEWANGRPELPYRQEREYDRRRRWLSLLPGQQELRDQARVLKIIGASFRQSPNLVRKLEHSFRQRMGQISDGDIEPCVIMGADGSVKLRCGVPLWKAPTMLATRTIDDSPTTVKTNTRAVMPGATTAEHSVFVGVTTRHNEDPSKKIWVQRSGLMYVRVNAGTYQKKDGASDVYVEVGDKLVRKLGADYLVKQADGDEGAPIVGEARERVTTNDTRLIQVMTPGSGGGTSGGPALWA